jgi:sugar O-acyltransferase (sialic acid O-acetyltransferase NeuD family)
VVAAQAIAAQRGEVCFGDETVPTGTSVNGISVRFSSLEEVKDWSVLVTIGNNEARARMQVRAEALGLSLAIFIVEPERCYAEHTGAGTMILAGAVVTSNVRLGRGVIVNTGAIVEHDSVIGNFCHLAPGSVVSGGATLGERVFLGANATVVNGISIAANSVIGAGCVVNRNIVEPGTYVGVPARRVRAGREG